MGDRSKLPRRFGKTRPSAADQERLWAAATVSGQQAIQQGLAAQHLRDLSFRATTAAFNKPTRAGNRGHTPSFNGSGRGLEHHRCRTGCGCVPLQPGQGTALHATRRLHPRDAFRKLLTHAPRAGPTAHDWLAAEDDPPDQGGRDDGYDGYAGDTDATQQPQAPRHRWTPERPRTRRDGNVRLATNWDKRHVPDVDKYVELRGVRAAEERVAALRRQKGAGAHFLHFLLLFCFPPLPPNVPFVTSHRLAAVQGS
jgi:hypothetical protein